MAMLGDHLIGHALLILSAGVFHFLGTAVG
jgi:hypothetical protein